MRIGAVLLLLVTLTVVQGKIPQHELESLLDLYYECDGENWKYTEGTDPFHPSNDYSPWGTLYGDPCEEKWFGILCNEDKNQVEILFPNPRFSGNRLIGKLGV